jgi:hypothetical protein
MTAIPRIAGAFTTIYRPKGDVFPGPDSQYLKAGHWYDRWVPNDHCFITGPDGRWHTFGITHPLTPMEPGSVHDGEWLAFHARAPRGKLKEHLSDSAWQDCPKVLPPERRPDERPELYAPFIVERNRRYHMFYGPEQIRLAVSDDLNHWTPIGPVFSHGRSARDPCILRDDGKYWMVYVVGNSVFARASQDLSTWSEEPIEIFRMDREGSPESPFIIRREETFYLFWCIYDGTHGLYDNRTFVYRSKAPWKPGTWSYVTRLQAHAPEIVQSENGAWYISSAEWPARGVSLAPLEWVASIS